MVVNGELTPHLFVRVNQKIKNKTQPFIYCGRLNYLSYEEGTSYPVHMIFQNLDYDDYTENEDLIDIYLWKPSNTQNRVQSPKTSPIEQISDRCEPKISNLQRVTLQSLKFCYRWSILLRESASNLAPASARNHPKI